MMLTILRIQFLRLRNNPLELLLVFVMPVLFFSIFAMIFSRGIASGTEQPVRLGLAVAERTAAAQALLTALENAESLECTQLELPLTTAGESAVTEAVERAQNSGRYDLVLQLPLGFDDSPEAAANSQKQSLLRVITDGQNAMAVAIVTSRLKEYYAQKNGRSGSDTANTCFTAAQGCRTPRGPRDGSWSRTIHPHRTPAGLSTSAAPR